MPAMKRIVRLFVTGACAGARDDGAAPATAGADRSRSSSATTSSTPVCGCGRRRLAARRGGRLGSRPPRTDHNSTRTAGCSAPARPGRSPSTGRTSRRGEYHYYCQLHGSRAGGMAGVVKIRPVAAVGDGDSARVIWSDSEAEAAHRYRVEFRRQGARKWKVWKRATSRDSGRVRSGRQPGEREPGP